MRVLLALKTSVALLMLSSCYVSRLAYEHSALLLKRQKISEAVSDGKVDEKTKAKLKEIQEILEFARQSGFNVGDAYEYFINLERSAVSYVVQGAPPEELKLKTWWFPIVGSVPYLGYYDEKDALKMQKELEDEGLETNVSGVSAYSSLGWFSDPVFTPMLKRSRESLAELIFHELTHRTIWIPDEAQFNERLADIVGKYTAIQYLEKKKDLAAIERLKSKHEDSQLFSHWVSRLKSDVEILIKKYRKKQINFANFKEEKRKIYAAAILEPLKPKFKLVDYVGNEAWNNASLMAANLYREPNLELDRALNCQEEPRLKKFFAKIEQVITQKKSAGFVKNPAETICVIF
ncbi:MAG: aminopeptidase [Oligoflexales bacterium]|nr:aminopeptidase [Oligoflexales bacterium]